MNLTEYEKLIQVLEDIPYLTGQEAKAIVKKHLAGRRVFCGHVERHRAAKEAQKLVDQGMLKADIVRSLVERFDISRQWSTTLTNNAINNRYQRKLQESQAKLKASAITVTRSMVSA